MISADPATLDAAVRSVERRGFDAVADELQLRGGARNAFRMLIEHASEHGARSAIDQLGAAVDGHPTLLLGSDERRMLDVVAEIALLGRRPNTGDLVSRLDWAPDKVRDVGARLRKRGLLN